MAGDIGKFVEKGELLFIAEGRKTCLATMSHNDYPIDLLLSYILIHKLSC